VPKFQRRHYQAIAEILADSVSESDHLFTREDLARVVNRLVVVFRADNPSFDPDRFLAVVYPSPVTRHR
jgi:hypothetical protein